MSKEELGLWICSACAFVLGALLTYFYLKATTGCVI